MKQNNSTPLWLILLCAALVVVMFAAGLLLARADGEYQQEEDYHQALLEYKPVRLAESVGQVTNVSLLELQTLYPDVVGWLAIPGTQIDYPFVYPKEENEYLRADLDHNYLASGTLFMDDRAQTDLTSFNSVIYGHYMKNGSMFGSLPDFRNSEVFARYPEGTLQLPYANYTLEIFAAVLTNRYDAAIYDCGQSSGEEKQAFLDTLRENAVQYRDIGATAEDVFVTLSTCSYEFSDARTVVVARLVPAEQSIGLLADEQEAAP